MLQDGIYCNMQPDSKQPVIHVRLHPKDRKQAQRLATQYGMPLSTWIRVVVIERLTKERA